MKALVLGLPELEQRLRQSGIRVTLDPADDVAVCVCDLKGVRYAPENVPVLVIGTGTVADLSIKKRYPNAEVVGVDEVAGKIVRLLPEGKREERSLSAEAGPGNGLFALTYANKGGVGKTTVAIGLALALAEAGVSTALCDFDLAGPNVADFFSLRVSEGIESVSQKPLDSLLARVADGLAVLPSKGVFVRPECQEGMGEALSQAVAGLKSRFAVVIGDTSPEPWEKTWLHPLFVMADLIYAVVDQSKFSVSETEKYAPTLLAMGVLPERIRIVLNRYDPKLVSVREVERCFSAGFKKGVVRPKVVAVIPESWRDHVKATHKGRLPDLEVFRRLAREILSSVGGGEGAERRNGGQRQRGLLKWLKTWADA